MLISQLTEATALLTSLKSFSMPRKIYKKDCTTHIGDKEIVVTLKWFRGAGRYNNGATIYKQKYNLRLILSRAKEHLKVS